MTTRQPTSDPSAAPDGEDPAADPSRHAGRLMAGRCLVAFLGGAGGTVLGTAATAAYASLQRWPTVVPAWVMAGGIGATAVIGALAGLYPAVRAARLAPAEAVSAP